MRGPDNTEPLKGAPLAVFDFETTGVDPTECHPVQVSVLHATLPSSRKEVPEYTVAYTTLIRPPVSVPEGAAKIHGLTDDKLVGAPGMAEVLPDLIAAFEGRIAVAYNLPYDYQVLRTACERHDRQAPRFAGIDPLPWSKTVDRYRKGGHKLVTVCKRRGIDLGNAHDATADCVATLGIVGPLMFEWAKHLRGRLGSEWDSARPLASLRNLWEWHCKDALAGERDFAAYRKNIGKPVTALPYHTLLGQAQPPGVAE